MLAALALTVGLAACAPAAAPASSGVPTPAAPAPATVADEAELPFRLAPRPTQPAITPEDLMIRLYIVADDSMMGREAGTPGNVKATEYIAAEARKIGLEPAGENGTFFQTVPLVRTAVAPTSVLAVDGATLSLWNDFVPLPASLGIPGLGSALRGDRIETVYAGSLGGARSPLTAQQTAGKLVVIGPPAGPIAPENLDYWARYGLDLFPAAAGVAVAALDFIPPTLIEEIREGGGTELGEAGGQPGQRGPLGMFISVAAADRLLGGAAASLQPGAVGTAVRAAVSFERQPTEAPARNVIAVLRGSDPVLRAEYVAIGAHNDHVGTEPTAVDHDSLRAFNRVLRPEGAENQPGPPTAAQRVQIRTTLDSLRRVHPPRRDSVFNGADDDGSGTVALLEIAQALASVEPRPKRSILFVWHTAEELGLYGSEYFTDHPTVPRDSIVAQLNVDMIGRGRADDLPSGGAGYLQLIGSRRLSTELGDLVETVNTRGDHGFRFDYQYDAKGHPQQIYCRSDHYNYARFGIPVVFFTTGSHRDYHQLTDEPQYIDYQQLARVSALIRDIALGIANLDHRPAIDRPRPDPNTPCVQ